MQIDITKSKTEIRKKLNKPKSMNDKCKNSICVVDVECMN